MNPSLIEKITASVKTLQATHPIGRVIEINGAVISVTGLSHI
jgi:hypothetical protein